MTLPCSVYRSCKRQGMYLYVLRDQALDELPEALVHYIGRLEHALDLDLGPERKLAQEDVLKVLENLQTQGFHVQMPPQQDDYIQHLPEELLTRNDPV